MALFGLGPWNEISPAFFTQAMERGASLGLSERQQEREEKSAADRLRLAYDQLHSMERRASEAAQTRLKIGMAAQALRAQQLGEMKDYRDNMIQLGKDRVALAAGKTKSDPFTNYQAQLLKGQVRDIDKQLAANEGERDESLKAKNRTLLITKQANASAMLRNLLGRSRSLPSSKTNATHVYNPNTGTLSPVDENYDPSMTEEEDQ